MLLRFLLFFILALTLFLFSLDLMMFSLHQLGGSVIQMLLMATSNPYTGLFIGLLLSALFQNSSATTSMTVALVASGTLSLSAATPVIMGANIGTTITSVVVSLSFIDRKKEFRRAVTAGSYHAFFNILTAVILFPLEYNFHFLSGLSHFVAVHFFNEPTVGTAVENFSLLDSWTGISVQIISEVIGNPYLLFGIAIFLLLSSILFFRKIISHTMGVEPQGKINNIFSSQYKSFVWGTFITAIIRSSTVTTSLVVPLAAKKIIKLRQSCAFILGANVGTTVTAFIVSTFNSNAAIGIAIAHFLFNIIGVLLFFQTPYLKEIPYRLAAGLSQLTLRHRIAGFLFLLFTFFLIPFSLIYLSR